MIWAALLGLLVGVLCLCARAITVHKDGGPDSMVTGYWLIEVKWLFSVALLRFDHGSCEVYHSHAFNSLSWVLGPGQLREEHIMGTTAVHRKSWRPVATHRWTFHRVFSEGRTWVLTFRGPWQRSWYEYNPETRRTVELTRGRRVVWQHLDPNAAAGRALA